MLLQTESLPSVQSHLWAHMSLPELIEQQAIIRQRMLALNTLMHSGDAQPSLTLMNNALQQAYSDLSELIDTRTHS